MNSSRITNTGHTPVVQWNQYKLLQCDACFERPSWLYKFRAGLYCYSCYLCKEHPGRFPLLESTVLQLRLRLRED